MEQAIIAILMNLSMPSTEPKIDIPGTEMKISKGMTKKQVIDALGAPSEVSRDPDRTLFIYHNNYTICDPKNGTGCSVDFDKNGLAYKADIRAKFMSEEFYY